MTSALIHLRNVKIHGEMENECYQVNGANPNGCNDDIHFDNFGGHIKTVAGFESFNIQSAEIYHMGQMMILGRYPIHFHLALDTTREWRSEIIGSFVRNNAIHHTFR